MDQAGYRSLVRILVGLKTNNLSVRLTADGAANVASGLAVAANGLALLTNPANARDLPRSPQFFVADYLPAIVNATRVFFGVGAVVLFWIITEWSSGLLAVTFATVTIMVVSPMQDEFRQSGTGTGFWRRGRRYRGFDHQIRNSTKP